MSQFFCNTCVQLWNARFHGYEEIKGEPICGDCYAEEASNEEAQVYPTPRTISGSTLPGSRKPHGEPGKENNDE